MLYALLLLPTIAGILAFLIRSDVLRRGLLLLTAAGHTGLIAMLWMESGTLTTPPGEGAWLALDAPGLLFLTIASGLFLLTAIYGVGSLLREKQHKTEEGFLFVKNAPEAIFSACLLLFLASMTLVCLSQHFGLLWVGIETTTLASAPLIYYHRNTHSLEAAWKYLLICSVGIALALMGNFLLAVAAAKPLVPGETHEELSMTVLDLCRNGALLHIQWLKAAFLFFLVGYGTKMGLAPMHTWLPDAYSEAPSTVSALLSGALLNCTFLGILRILQVCVAAGIGPFARELLMLFGLISLATAAFFIIGQINYKRMLAYSSVEHIGILALGMGLGAGGVYGSIYHALNHSLVKALLFLTAGNILFAYRTKSAANVRGLLKHIPWTGVLWVFGFLGITGCPPFGTFFSEFTILRAALETGHPVVAALYLLCLGAIFVGMASIVFKMTHGPLSDHAPKPLQQESGWTLISPLVLVVLAITFGLWLPEPLETLLQDAAKTLGGAAQ